MLAFPERVGTIGGLFALLGCLLLALPAAASACGEMAPPEIKTAKASPASLPSDGGTITLIAEVESDCGLEVYAEVSTSEGLQWSFQMLPTGDPNSALRYYRSEIAAPANSRREPFYYEFSIRAIDEVEGSSEAFAGGTEVAEAFQFDEAPYISNAKVTPSLLSYIGGPVTISADITDNRSVAAAFANVMLPDETQQDVWLEPVSATHFEGQFTVPPNLGTNPTAYSAIVYGEDDIGQRSWESAGNFTVEPQGPLEVRIGRSDFGRVRLGESSNRTVIIHYAGYPGAQPIPMSATTSGAPFSVRGATAGKFDFTIRPGKTRSFKVDFTPTAVQLETGMVILSRVDGTEPDYRLTVTGEGRNPIRR
jgi:hypothetical protein